MKPQPVMLLLIILFAALAASAQTDDMDDMTESEPRLSYLICDWGLLTVEYPTESEPVFIEIDSPADYSGVEGTTFTVSGTGAGLFEGNVIVEVSVDGETAVTEFGVLQAEELGAVGDWSVDLSLDDMMLDGATRVVVTAYSESPQDGSTVALDTVRLNVNSEFPLRFVEIDRPTFGAGVSASPLLIEGTAAGAFENNVVIEVQDADSGDVLAETFATIQTDELGGIGSISAEVMVEAEPGTPIEVFAYHSPVAEGEEIEVSAVQFAYVSPLAQTYDAFLVINADDPINGAPEVCAQAAAEFENEDINPLVINDVIVQETRSMTPLTNVTIEAAGSSNCPAPLRTRAVRDGESFDITVYRDFSEPVACTADLAPITERISLGTLPNPDFSITVNGETVE